MAVHNEHEARDYAKQRRLAGKQRMKCYRVWMGESACLVDAVSVQHAKDKVVELHGETPTSVECLSK